MAKLQPWVSRQSLAKLALLRKIASSDSWVRLPRVGIISSKPILAASRSLFALSRGYSLLQHPEHNRLQTVQNPAKIPSVSQDRYSAPIIPTDAAPGAYITIEERRSGATIATITIHNPRKVNILNTSILKQIHHTCLNLSLNHSTLRAVVLTGGLTTPGKSPAFSGGADISEMSALSSVQTAEAFITNVSDACSSIRGLPVPVIARVHGVTLGAGLELMASCDLRVATDSSMFGMPEVKVGIPSVVEAALLPGLIGTGRTRRLLYLAETLSATEAQQWGLIEQVVSAPPSTGSATAENNDTTLNQALDAAVETWLSALLAAAPNAIATQKRLMQQWENSATLDDAIGAGVKAFGEAYADGGTEPREYMSRFVNRSSS